MDEILSYIRSTYSPLSLILYGSYADGTAAPDSDFDALAIVEAGEYHHDTIRVGDVILDLFVYPRAALTEGWDPENFVQTFDGIILYDTDDLACTLQRRVRAYVQQCAEKTVAERRDAVVWCEKMLLRTRRQDAEGMYRWHWLLTESLSIFCEVVAYPYFGPKKTLRWMQRSYPLAYERYSTALFHMDAEALEEWIRCLREYLPDEGKTDEKD